MGNTGSQAQGPGRTFKNRNFERRTWLMDSRYRPREYIAEGYSGQVIRAKDKRLGTRVAIKRMAGDLSNPVRTRVIYRELRALRQFDHPNVLALLDAFTPGADAESMREVYFVMPFFKKDLYVVIYEENFPDPIPEERIRTYTAQILQGLDYLHSGGIVHRDLKPENVCIGDNNRVVIVDFGLSKQLRDDMTAGAGTIIYEAPEQFYGGAYTQKVDMWAVAVLVCNMFIRGRIFDKIDLNALIPEIFNLLGTPPQYILDRITNPRVIAALPPARHRTPNLAGVLNMASGEAIAFVLNLFNYDPELRFSASQALTHPFVFFHRTAGLAPTRLEGYDAGQQEEDMSGAQWRQAVFDELQNFPDSNA